MVLTSENLLTLVTILSVIIGAVSYISRRQADVRLKDAESRATDAETRATAAKTELTKAQGDAAQQTGLIETLRELVKVNQANAQAGQEIVTAIKEGTRQEADNYRELRKQMDANTSFVNSNVIALGERVGVLGSDLFKAIERMSKLVGETNYDKVNEMIARLEMVATKVSASTPNGAQNLLEEQKVGGDGTNGTDRTPPSTE